VLIKDPTIKASTTPQARRYTTLWNINIGFSILRVEYMADFTRECRATFEVWWDL